MCSSIQSEVLSCTWHALSCLITNPCEEHVGTLESLVTLCTQFLLCNLNPSTWKIHSQHNLLWKVILGFLPEFLLVLRWTSLFLWHTLVLQET